MCTTHFGVTMAKAAVTRQTKTAGKLVLANSVGHKYSLSLFVANSLPTCLPTVVVSFTHANLTLPTQVANLSLWCEVRLKEAGYTCMYLVRKACARKVRFKEALRFCMLVYFYSKSVCTGKYTSLQISSQATHACILRSKSVCTAYFVVATAKTSRLAIHVCIPRLKSVCAGKYPSVQGTIQTLHVCISCSKSVFTTHFGIATVKKAGYRRMYTSF